MDWSSPGTIARRLMPASIRIVSSAAAMTMKSEELVKEASMLPSCSGK